MKPAYRRLIVIAIAIAALAALALGAVVYQRLGGGQQLLSGSAAEGMLVRPDAPVLGPVEARVTIVEFFDPACESCRIFHPLVKRALRQYDGEVRLVLRYAAFHGVSEEAIRILEAARLQQRFAAVLDALLEYQPHWAGHSQPDIAAAWQVAEQAGLDLAQARQDAQLQAVSALIRRDALDIEALGVRQTPTIYINGTPLQDYSLSGFSSQVRAAVEASRAGTD